MGDPAVHKVLDVDLLVIQCLEFKAKEAVLVETRSDEPTTGGTSDSGKIQFQVDSGPANFATKVIVGYVHFIDMLISPLLLTSPLRQMRSISIGPITIDLRGKTERSYDAVLKKLNDAQRYLSEAAQSFDELQTAYESEDKRLGKLHTEVTEKREEYRRAVKELETAKELSLRESEALRKVLGIDQRRDRIVGFVSGVVASAVVAALFEWTDDLYNLAVRLFSLAI